MASFYLCFFFGDSLLKHVTSHLMSCQVTFHSSLTVQSYARQLNILTNRTTTLDVYSVLNSRLIADWPVENMKPNMTPNRML